MARKKRFLLSPDNEYDLTNSPERVSCNAHSWVGKCASCGQFASSETVKGKGVGRRHRGVTARQRTRLQTQEAGELLPIQHGHASHYARSRVEESVADYRSRHGNVDWTDEDLLHLRACQQERLAVGRTHLIPLTAIEAFLADTTAQG